MSQPLPLDIKNAWEAQTLTHDRPLLCGACSPCGRYFVAGAQDENLLRWELASGEKRVLAGHTSWVQAVAFHPDRERLLAGDLHGVLRCWRVTAAEPTVSWSVEQAHPWVQAIATTPDGQSWLTAGTDGVIRQWKADTGAAVGEFTGHDTEVYSLAVHPEGQLLLSGDLRGRIHVWDLATRQRLRTLDAQPLHTRKEDFLADVGGVRSLAIRGDGTQVSAGGMTDAESNTFCPGKPAVLVFDFASGQLVRTLRLREKSDGPIKGLAYLGNDVLAAHAEHLNGTSSLEFFAAATGESLHSIKRESGYTLSPHPDGARLAVAGFVSRGRGGNGRHAKPEEYVTHGGAVTLYRLDGKKPA